MSNNPTIVPTSLVDVEHILEAAIQKWLQENCTPEQVKRWVDHQLSESRQNVLLKLLGFDIHRYDQEWELDHCNGRAGNSAAGDRLRALIGENIKTWLSENSLKLPKLPASANEPCPEKVSLTSS